MGEFQSADLEIDTADLDDAAKTRPRELGYLLDESEEPAPTRKPDRWLVAPR